MKLTELQYAKSPAYPLRVYVYRADGYHDGGTFVFDNAGLQLQLEGPIALAQREGREVRVTDDGDFLVLHIQGGKVVWPDANA